MDGLLAKGIDEIIDCFAEEIGKTRIFGSRIVDEIKAKIEQFHMKYNVWLYKRLTIKQ